MTIESVVAHVVNTAERMTRKQSFNYLGESQWWLTSVICDDDDLTHITRAFGGMHSKTRACVAVKLLFEKHFSRGCIIESLEDACRTGVLSGESVRQLQACASGSFTDHVAGDHASWLAEGCGNRLLVLEAAEAIKLYVEEMGE